MIPVLGVPILNRFDLLEGMLATVDQPVHRTIIIDNGTVCPPGWFSEPPPGRHVVHTGVNLGVSASWNLIVKSAPEARWWFIASSDIEFPPGELAMVEESVEGNLRCLWMLGSMTSFAISQEVVSRVGWFDENFVPAYFEDNDYAYRAKLAGIEVQHLPTALIHHGSSTVHSDRQLANENARTFPENQRYYIHKWGGGPGEERFITPFNRGGDLRDWALDYRRLHDQSWRPNWGALR